MKKDLNTVIFASSLIGSGLLIMLALSLKNSHLETKVHEDDATIHKLSVKVSVLEQTVNKDNSTIDGLKTKLNVQQATIIANQHQLQNFGNQCRNLIDSTFRLKTDVAAKTSEIARLSAKVGARDAEIASLTKTVSDANELYIKALNSGQGDLAAAKKKIDEANAQIQLANQEKEQINSDLNAKKADLNTLNGTLTSNTEQIARLRLQIENDGGAVAYQDFGISINGGGITRLSSLSTGEFHVPAATRHVELYIYLNNKLNQVDDQDIDLDFQQIDEERLAADHYARSAIHRKFSKNALSDSFGIRIGSQSDADDRQLAGGKYTWRIGVTDQAGKQFSRDVSYVVDVSPSNS